ncbi:major facilitator superfamily domain-containing protein [Geopyxis carbonaria]|nr:major facilitator superfamily domain-containing protein [Geopyxis carbonaria]
MVNHDNSTLQAPTDLPVLSTSVSNPSAAAATATAKDTEAGAPSSSDDASTSTTDAGEPSYPEGGRTAWLTVLGSFLSMLASFGIMNTIGTFQAHLATHQLAHMSEGQIGWIFGLYAFVSFFGGIIIGPIFDVYGPRWLLVAGSTCLIVGLVTFSVCVEYWQFILSFGILTGLGTCLIFTPAIASIGHWFLARRAYATGLATTGGSIGGIVFPLTIQAAIPRVGFGWAVRIVALLCLCLVVSGNSLIRARTAIISPRSGAKSRVAIEFDWAAFRDPRFALTTMGVFLIEWGVFVPLTYIVSYAIHLGLTHAFAFQLLAILNVGSVFGRWLPGLVADKLGRFNTMLLTVSLCLLSVLAFWLPTALVAPLPAHAPKALMTTFALLYGFASGSGISLTPVCVGQICSTKDYGKRFGTCYFFVSFGTLTGAPIAGEIVRRMGGAYAGLIAFTAASYVGAFVFFGAARVVGGGWRWTRW